MTIGEALKQIRGELCLTQKQMCAEIVTRSFYAKVESGKSMISADKLAEILLVMMLILITFISYFVKLTCRNQNK